MNRFAHIGVGMHRIDKVHVGIFPAQFFYSCYHVNKTVAEILTAMGGYQHHLSATGKPVAVVSGFLYSFVLLICQRRVILQSVYHHIESIDNGVSCDSNFVFINVLVQQILAAHWSGRKMIGGYTSRQLAVHLLWPGTIPIIGTQACLYMTDRYLLIESCQCCRSGSGCVAMNQHHVGLFFQQHLTHAQQHTTGHIIQVLPQFHDV